jgi:hypothetical protein
MKKYINLFGVVILFIINLSLNSCFPPKEIKENLIAYTKQDFNKDSVLVENFIKIDSIVKKNKRSKSYYCPIEVVKLLHTKTGISGSGDGSIIGYKFTLEDWIKWHKWFKNNFR